MMSRSTIACLCVIQLAVVVTLHSAEISRSDLELFETKIRAVLAERCFQCHSHQAEKLKANLYLDTRSGLLKGSDAGIVVVPGQANASGLIEAIRYNNPDLQMPPKGKLPASVIEDFVRWIDQGAPWPEFDKAPPAVNSSHPSESGTEEWFNERRQHWAYQPVRNIAPPKVTGLDWGQSDIDQFVAAKLAEQKLSPAPPADRRTLIRRATYDLIGLPPTPGEVDRFVHDRDPRAFAKVIDRLLSSPHYGERWARHWLDLVRYSETLGFEFDYDLYHAWRYRDYGVHREALKFD